MIRGAAAAVVLGLVGLGAAGCGGDLGLVATDAGTNPDAPASSPDVPVTGSDAPAEAGGGPFQMEALAIAAEYTAWGRVDDELRWAPFLCRLPLPGIARPSMSADSSTHGQKLYSVFVKNHDAYPGGPYDGQVVVKESWIPERVDDPDAGFNPGRADAGQGEDAGDHFYPYAQGDGGIYRAAQKAGLYILYKLDPSTPDTDEGWVYATVTTDGQVTASGRVASCMGCHETATHERLFGVPLSPAQP